MNNRAADKATMDNIKDEGLKKRYSIKRSSPCRRSTNLFSYYFSEIALIVIIILHTLLHSIIIIASLPPFCDSSNIEWVPDSNTTIGKIFDIFHCHYKHNLYYSDVFMLSGITPPLLLLLSLLYKSR